MIDHLLLISLFCDIEMSECSIVKCSTCERWKGDDGRGHGPHLSDVTDIISRPSAEKHSSLLTWSYFY